MQLCFSDLCLLTAEVLWGQGIGSAPFKNFPMHMRMYNIHKYINHSRSRKTAAVIIIAAAMGILQRKQACNKIFVVTANERLHRKDWEEAGRKRCM